MSEDATTMKSTSSHSSHGLPSPEWELVRGLRIWGEGPCDVKIHVKSFT